MNRIQRAAQRQSNLYRSLSPAELAATMHVGRIGWGMWGLGGLTYLGLDLISAAWDPHWAVRLLLVLAALLLASVVLSRLMNRFARACVSRRGFDSLLSFIEAALAAPRRRAASTKLAPEDRLAPVAEMGCPYCEVEPGVRHLRTCRSIPRTWFNA